MTAGTDMDESTTYFVVEWYNSEFHSQIWQSLATFSARTFEKNRDDAQEFLANEALAYPHDSFRLIRVSREIVETVTGSVYNAADRFK